MKMIGNVSDWLSYAGGALIKVADSAGSTVVYIVSVCKIGIKYHCASRVVCTYAHDFLKRPGFALIGAYALIRTNRVLY